MPFTHIPIPNIRINPEDLGRGYHEKFQRACEVIDDVVESHNNAVDAGQHADQVLGQVQDLHNQTRAISESGLPNQSEQRGRALISNGGHTYWGMPTYGSHILSLEGGQYQTTAGTVTGAMKIRLPNVTSATMMQFWVDVYNYSTDTSRSFKISGYPYYFASRIWYNTSAESLGGVGAGFTVRFGHDGTHYCVLIGETTTSWAYPQVCVRDFFAGYANHSAENWQSGWEVAFITDLAGIAITKTHANTSVYSPRNKPTPQDIGALPSGATAVNSHKLENYSRSQIISDARSGLYPVNQNIEIAKNSPKLVLRSSQSGANNNEQAATISLGESGTGAAALHMAYTGDGYSYIGMGSLGSNNIPDNWVMEMHYQNRWVRFPGPIYLDNFSSRIERGDSNSVRISSNHGYVNIGPQNNEWCHIVTDRPRVYIGNPLWANGDIGIYNSGTYMRSSDGKIIEKGIAIDGRYQAKKAALDQVNTNQGIWGSVQVNGSKAGYSGFYFPDQQRYLMVSDRYSGVHRTDGWQWLFDGSTLVHGVVPWTRLSSVPVYATRWPSAAEAGALPAGGTAVNADKVDGLHAIDFLRSNASQTFTGYLVGGHSSSNCDAGIYGAYNPLKTHHIWSMGTAYRCAADGSNFGNLYGFGYKHTNNATGGHMAHGHQAVWCQNGTPHVALGSNIWTSGNITAFSDRRVKTNIQTIPNALQKVSALKGCTFYRTDINDDAGQPVRQTGLIAQDVMQVLPEAVSGYDPNNPDARLSLAYGNLAGLFVEAIKSLNQEIETLKQRLPTEE